MNTALAVLLAILSFNLMAAQYVITGTTPPFDTDGLALTDADMAYYTFHCGTATGVYDADKIYQTAGRDGNGLFIKSFTATINTAGISGLYCAQTVSRQWTDENNVVQVMAPSPLSPEAYVVPEPGLPSAPVTAPTIVKFTITIIAP